MKTFVVREPNGNGCYVTNAETACEAAQYAMARGDLRLKQYLVIDHDLEACMVDVSTTAVAP